MRIESLFVEMGLGAFACRLEAGDEVVTATINVYQPADSDVEYLDSGKITG